MITLPLSSKRGCLKKNYHYNYQNKRIMAAQPDRQMRLSPGNTSTIFKNIFFSLWNNGLITLLKLKGSLGLFINNSGWIHMIQP